MSKEGFVKMKYYRYVISFCLSLCLIGLFAGCSFAATDPALTQEINETTSAIPPCEEATDPLDAEEMQPKDTPMLLRNLPESYYRYFYVYNLKARIFDADLNCYMDWYYVGSPDEEHNAWIDTQVFNSLFRYGEWCIRTGYYKDTGKWTITIFTYHGLYTQYIGMGHSYGTTITYDMDPHVDFPCSFFGGRDDCSVEITAFDESKHTITLTFTSPEGETTHAYINYVERLRCDENGTPLKDKNGYTFLYQFD